MVVTNIHQLQGEENRWLQNLPDDFFDLILFDEGHHNVAQSWKTLKDKCPTARIVNFSATPLRADGQLMAGRILYSYSVFRAWTLLTKVETSCDRILIAGGANVEAEWEQGPAV